MIFEIFLAILFGFLLGLITGLMPGIHTNLVFAILISFLPFLAPLFSTMPLVVFIITLSVVNIFIEFIPTVYLGAPDEDSVLTTIPGHEFLLRGKAHQAIFLSSLGSLVGIFSSVLISILFLFFLGRTYPFFEKMMAWILLWISIFLIYGEKRKTMTFIFFILSGFLGFTSLNMNVSQPLLPLLTGLFGTSSIILSIEQETKIPKQQTKLDKINKKEFIKPTFSGILTSPLFSFLPGLGSSQATIISSKITGNLNRKQFIYLNGFINTILMVLSFTTLFLINKSRTGSANALSEVVSLTHVLLFQIIFLIILVSIFAFLITLFLSKKVSNKINDINYIFLSKIILYILIIITFIISGIYGLTVLMASTFLGIACQLAGIRKGVLMGCLLIPTIIIYLPF